MNTQDLEDLGVDAERELSVVVPQFVRVKGRLPTRDEMRRIRRTLPGEAIAS